MIIVNLEATPGPGTSLCIANYMIEIIQTSANAVKTLKIGALPGTEGREEEKSAEQ